MSRGKPNRVVRADHWDPDEDVSLSGGLSFGASQRVAFHAARVDALTAQLNVDDPDQQLVADITGHMASVLLEVIVSWRLRDTGVPYQEGVDRPILGDGRPTADLLEALDMDDVGYLFSVALPKRGDTPATELITPEAAGEGLHPR